MREEKHLTLADAIRKFTRAASAADAADGSRRVETWHVGAMWWSSIRRRSRTRRRLKSPNQLSEGMEYVLVNGVPVIAEVE